MLSQSPTLFKNKTHVEPQKMAKFPVASFCQISLLLVLICWTTCSTGAAFSLEEEFLQLKENYVQMKEVVKSLESKVIRLESKDDEMQEKVAELEAKVQQQDSLLTTLLREKNNRTAANGFGSSQATTIANNGLPSSCSDLRMTGHIWSGFYSVMGLTRMESVYCDFTKLPDDAGFQKLIGYVDVKSAPVHFYVQKNSSFDTSFTPITYELAMVNEGNAMNLTSGIFTAPVPGTYFFSFTGLASLSGDSPQFYADLFFNGNRIGRGWITDSNSSNSLRPFTLESTLNLKKGDQLWMEIVTVRGSVLYDGDWHSTHFTGFLLDEEIVATL